MLLQHETMNGELLESARINIIREPLLDTALSVERRIKKKENKRRALRILYEMALEKIAA